jgi:rhodanese-related sulfurtransferase
MHGNRASVSPTDLHQRLGTASSPVVIDVRRTAPDPAADRLIVSASHHPPDEVAHWSKALPKGRQVVAYCVHGHEVSQSVSNTLRAAGFDAAFLEGGIDGWTEKQLPTRRIVGNSDKWVTREHPKIDRIACPWLVSRFINPQAQFVYVPANEVPAVAKQTGAVPYDIKDVEFGHVGDHCSFDAIIRIHDIHDAALDHLATIVRGADTSRPDLTPQCEGLLAMSYGLSSNYPDDHEMLKHGMIMYDALYAWCRLQLARHRTAA